MSELFLEKVDANIIQAHGLCPNFFFDWVDAQSFHAHGLCPDFLDKVDARDHRKLFIRYGYIITEFRL